MKKSGSSALWTKHHPWPRPQWEGGLLEHVVSPCQYHPGPSPSLRPMTGNLACRAQSTAWQRSECPFWLLHGTLLAKDSLLPHPPAQSCLRVLEWAGPPRRSQVLGQPCHLTRALPSPGCGCLPLLSICLSPSPHDLCGRMPFGKLNIASRWKQDRKGIVFIFALLNMLGKRRVQGNLYKLKKVHLIFFDNAPCWQAKLRGRGDRVRSQRECSAEEPFWKAVC